MALAENENDKTRVLDYGADEFATKPISTETIVDKNQCHVNDKGT